jgi:hypothetical protein
MFVESCFSIHRVTVAIVGWALNCKVLVADRFEVVNEHSGAVLTVRDILLLEIKSVAKARKKVVVFRQRDALRGLVIVALVLYSGQPSSCITY